MSFYQRKNNPAEVVHAVRFNSLNEHKCQLPDGVLGIPSPGAGNCAYMGCEFFMWANGEDVRVPVQCGDWILTDAFGFSFPVSAQAFKAEWAAVKT